MLLGLVLLCSGLLTVLGMLGVLWLMSKPLAQLESAVNQLHRGYQAQAVELAILRAAAQPLASVTPIKRG